MVSFFCYVGIVPGMPQTEIARQIYGYLALGFMLGGGVIVIIFFKPYYNIQTAMYLRMNAALKWAAFN